MAEESIQPPDTTCEGEGSDNHSPNPTHIDTQQDQRLCLAEAGNTANDDNNEHIGREPAKEDEGERKLGGREPEDHNNQQLGEGPRGDGHYQQLRIEPKAVDNNNRQLERVPMMIQGMEESEAQTVVSNESLER
jgi:hypothetical protein